MWSVFFLPSNHDSAKEGCSTRGEIKMRNLDRELIIGRERDEERKQERERKERSQSRPLKIPSLLSSAESKMQLTGGKKDGIDFSLLSSAFCLSLSFLLLLDSLGITLLSLFLLHSFGMQMLIYNPYF